MHPSKTDLKLFVDERLDDSGKESHISTHLEKCEFCREFCDNYRLYSESLEKASEEEIPKKFNKLADRLFEESFNINIIYLTPLEKSAVSLSLAADGEKEPKTGVENLSTFYSDDPELVLRVMRDNIKGHDYLQLISDNQEITSNVLVQIPELKKEFLTDNRGQAKIEETLVMDLSHLKWQVKMPNATFSLKPLVHDPEAVEYEKEMVLETEKDDKILIRFEGKTEGKQISIRVLQLEGNIDFGFVRVLVSQKDSKQIKDTAPDREILFNITEPGAEINIRLFQ